MTSIQTIFLYNFLKRMSHEDRLAGVRDLMNVWPDDWLDDAIAIAREIRHARNPVPPRRPDPRLIRVVP